MLKHDRTELTREDMMEMMDGILMVLKDCVSYDRERVQVEG